MTLVRPVHHLAGRRVVDVKAMFTHHVAFSVGLGRERNWAFGALERFLAYSSKKRYIVSDHSDITKFNIISYTGDQGMVKLRKEGTCLFDINIKHNTEIYIGKIISGDSH